MATASALIAQIQVELGAANADSQANSLFASANLYGWLDEAQREFAKRTMCLRGVNGQTVVTNQDSLPLPDDCLLVEAVIARKNWNRKVKKVTPTDFINQQTGVQTALATDPSIWCEMDGRIYVFPRYSNSSLTSTLNATTTAAATTLTLASTGNLRSYGRVLIGSEEIEYTGKSTTTLTGCRRGVAQTTAASYASGQTVTQIDVDILYRRMPIALASTASPEIRSSYHDLLKYYVKHMALTAEGALEKASAQFELWDKGVTEAEYTAKREALGTVTIRDTETQSLSDMYGPI